MKKTLTLTAVFVMLFLNILYAQNTDSVAVKQLDINNASLQQIESLPISKDLAKKIYERVFYRGDFKNIYELRQVEGIDQKLFLKLKSLIRVEPYRTTSSTQQRIEQLYYRLDRWSSNEGTSDALIDLWIEKVLDPVDVNTASYDELINLQNLTPVDVVSIMKYRTETGGIRSMRDMRGIDGLSYYGYANARNFVSYGNEPAVPGLFHGHITMRQDNTPYMVTEGDLTEQVGLANLTAGAFQGASTQPNQYVKGSFSFERTYKMGFSYIRNLGEPLYYYNNNGLQIPKMKFFVGLEDIPFEVPGLSNPLVLKKLYAGNYSVTFGQGVVIENTDFFMPRKSGFGFRKRFKGIAGDNSRTREFALRGVAGEVSFGNLSAIGFASYAPRDAILNKTDMDSTGRHSFNQLIILNQRFMYAPDDASRLPAQTDLSWLDAVNELTLGSHLQYDFQPGTWLGLSYYESAYDRLLNPDPTEITAAGDWSARQVTADNEIKQSYGGSIARGSNPFWDKAVSFRRVFGLDFQTVVKNISFSGEYGVLDKGGNLFDLSANPNALVLSAFVQYPSFNLFALYRNYSEGYDNPYQRSFSNYSRFKGTIFEKDYYLQSSLYSQLYSNGAQPQAEEGFYLSSFYQLTRQLTTRFEYDNWSRKSDAAAQYRLVGTLNYNPIYPLQIQLRQKWQARDAQNNISLRYFKSLEFRGRARMRLSNFDSFNLIYVNGKTIVHPRPRVFGDMVLGSEAYGGGLIHNFTKGLKLSGMLMYYKGFFWNFEDTQFIVTESTRGALRYWASLYMRMNSFFSMRLKYTADFQLPIQNINFNNVGTPVSGQFNSARWNRDIQKTFYLELNYNF